jgi:NAD(P)-dependent dehydrogenase (short-subunit alcohol dehydrogenase family)
VTGVASGIGFAVADVLRNRGDRVFGVDYQRGDDWFVADLSQASARTQTVDLAIEQLGGIDVLINVAGVYRPTPVPGSSLDDWRLLWQVNLEAPLELMSLALPHMMKQGFGRIVNITSVHANFSRLDCLAYDVGKAGLEAATRSIALAGAPSGVLVNSVAPGFVRTQMSLNEDGVDEADTDQFKQQYVETGRLPLGRAADPSEVAKTVSWLAGYSNSYVTGQVLTVDGGLTATF